jgi:hypothetical protein
MLASIAYVTVQRKPIKPDCLLHRFLILEICNIVTILFLVLCRGGPAGELPNVQIYEGHRDVTGIIVKMVLVNSGFHTHTQKFLRKLSTIWARTLKDIRQPSPRPKKFKEYKFERAPNY